MNSHNVYSEIEISSEVLTATPHRQIQLLLEKCLLQMQLAKKALINKEYANKHLAMGRAIEILTYLRMCLNLKNPDAIDLSGRLDTLYAFTADSLRKANLANDPQLIDQAYNTLNTIKEGWDGIG
jgi:flagellar secretion chaperone FliS